MSDASLEHPIYTKVKHEESTATQLWFITCDEGWRSTIVCERMYEGAADWLLSVLGRPELSTSHRRSPATIERLRAENEQLRAERDALLDLRDKAREWAKEVRIWFRQSEIFEPTEIDLLAAVDALQPTEGAQP